MGRFFSNIQIYNNQKKNQEQFIKLFCKKMESRGLVVGKEDDSSCSYILSFSEDNAWITICSVDYGSDNKFVKKDVKEFSEWLNTCCISVNVVDSDFSFLQMYDEKSSITDTVLVGDGSGYGFANKQNFQGKQEYWKPFFKENITWEQFSEVCNNNSTFVEDSLCELAELLGMNCDDIVSEYDDLSGNENKNIVEIFFKKKEQKKRALSLNSAFKQIYGEALEPLGFKKIKGKQPYFVRTVNGGEIIHVITYVNENCSYPNYKEFSIRGGIATVYRNSIDLLQNPINNVAWLSNVSSFYKIPKTFSYSENFNRIISKFAYKLEDGESIINSLLYSLEAVQKFMLPILNEIDDLEMCIKFLEKFHLPISTNGFNLNFDFNSCNHYDEGFLYVKTNYKELKEKWERVLIGDIFVDINTQKKIADLYKFFNDPIVNGKALEELERRKIINLGILKSYGLI